MQHASASDITGEESENAASRGASLILWRIAPSVLRARVGYHLTVLAWHAAARAQEGGARPHATGLMRGYALQHYIELLLYGPAKQSSAAGGSPLRRFSSFGITEVRLGICVCVQF